MTNPFHTKDLEAELGYSFSDVSLLESALTHPSLASGKGHKKNHSSKYERLEFLGDRVLGLVVAHWVYELFPDAPEGDLAKRHAALVNRDALRRVAQKINLEKYLQLIRNASGARQNLAALSDATEAVLGAMYLDGGLLPAEKFIKKLWDEEVHEEVAPADSKSALQEWAQGKGLPLPFYRVVKKEGPAHAPLFNIEVSVKSCEPVVCEGTSKREAEKAAAEKMLEIIEGT